MRECAQDSFMYRMPITKYDIILRNFFVGFIRLHLLYHAAQEPIFGLDMIRELATHGYQLSPGTLYPMLHGLERDGFLASQKETVRGNVRKVYKITKAGREVLAESLEKVRELLHEVHV